jgi:hypothetical protein
LEGGYPADACGAICLSSRSLGKLLAKIQPTNLEMNPTSLMIKPVSKVPIQKSDRFLPGQFALFCIDEIKDVPGSGHYEKLAAFPGRMQGLAKVLGLD